MDSADEILSKELAKLGSLGGAFGDNSGKMGALGAQFAARFLPTEQYTETVRFSLPPDKVLKYGYSVLAKMGALQKHADADAPYPFLAAVIGSGAFNMNPAVVYFEILDSDSTVTITGTAKEGLIKQHTAEKAVKRVIVELKKALL